MRAGFSLLEVLLAMVVLGIAVVGIAQGFAVGLRATAAARDTTTVQALARAKLAEIDAGLYAAGQGAQGDFEDLGEPEITWTLESLATGRPGLFEQTLTVVYDDRGEPREFRVVRWKYDAGSAASSGTATEK
jgi:prepilin-type N-terminal cleavage/methylation domain-containing protein